VQANLRYPQSVEAAVRDADIVINLVGILFERGRQRFDAVQAEGAEAVALAAKAAGATLVHVSAIGADAAAPSLYAQSKAEGERRVLAALPEATIMRPSIVFGPEDDFFNRFAALARMAPALPLPGGGHTRFQPVFAGDVAKAIAKAVDGDTKPGAIYELGGPCDDPAPQALGAGAVCAAEIASSVAAVPAEATAHARPGRTAQVRQYCFRRCQARRPHARSARHRAGIDGRDRAVLSVALPQERSVQSAHGIDVGFPLARQ
jgi:uncharacterized protein YbjT (DUF2867 family)